MTRVRVIVMAVCVTAMAGTARAQWVHYPSPGIPRTKDGKADLGAPAPRGSDGRVDLSGVWQAAAAPIPLLMKLIKGGQNGLGEAVPSQYFINILADFLGGQAPLTPAAARASASLAQDKAVPDSPLYCLPSGMPLFLTAPAPFKIVQAKGVTVMLSESDGSFRQIFTDGRALPADTTPSWLGSSTGRWQGDTFVVETAGLNDRSQLDAIGHRHSAALRITERYTRPDAGHLQAQITLTDPNTFTRPLTVKVGFDLQADTDLIEYFCTENEKDSRRIHATN